jgi:hypothetical protein
MPGPTAVGRDAIAGVAQGFMAAFPDLKVIMDDIVVDGNQMVLNEMAMLVRRAKPA